MRKVKEIADELERNTKGEGAQIRANYISLALLEVITDIRELLIEINKNALR